MPDTVASLTYTAGEVVTLMAAFGVLLTGVTAGIVNIIVAVRTTAALEKTNIAVSEVSAKADVISGHVNSSATLASAKIASLETRIEQLIAAATAARETAAVLAATTAQKPPAPP
jgi:hypothetical protein